MAYTLKFTVAAPSLATPVNALYTSDNLITVNLLPAATGPVDVSKLPLKITNNNDINVSNAFPTGSLFTSIDYTGPDLHLYDKDGKEIDTSSKTIEHNKVTKILAGEPSKNKEESNIGMIIGIVIGSLFFIGCCYLAYMYFSAPKETNNRFNSGE